MKFSILSILVLSLIAAMQTGCATAPATASKKASLHANVLAAIATFKAEDSSMQEFFDSAKGYALFPSIGKGAIGIGGAYGRGELLENHEVVGYCDLTLGTIGFQLGGQAYSEIIFFERSSSLSDFKNGTIEFAAQASAVAVTAGASTDADYEGGVAVFTMTKGGLMYEASIGGQGFSYEPK